jgi:curli biogenesis system outer membrane secretion channel CsgG
MKKLFILLTLAVTTQSFAQETEAFIPQIAVLDVVSGAYKDGQTRLFTDILRSQLFKTEIFRVIEPGVIQKTIQDENVQLSGRNHDSQFLSLGKSLAVDKILITNIEKFSDSIALNARIVDVETSTIDFTDIIFVDHEEQIRESLNEMVLKIDIHFRGKESPTVQDLVNAKPLSEEQKREALWRRMGASGDTWDS